MTEEELAAIALKELRSTEDDGWSYLLDADSFGLFRWEDFEDAEIEHSDINSAREKAESGEYCIVWLVPLVIDSAIEGTAVFTGYAGGAPEDEPNLEGVFRTRDDAIAYLKTIGVCAIDPA